MEFHRVQHCLQSLEAVLQAHERHHVVGRLFREVSRVQIRIFRTGKSRSLFLQLLLSCSSFRPPLLMLVICLKRATGFHYQHFLASNISVHGKIYWVRVSKSNSDEFLK